MPTYEDIRIRFWRHVDKNGPNGCWIWIAAKTSTGYGQVNVNGKPMKAHRVSFQLCKGPIPDGLEICHMCDNRVCVNPAHLFPGNHAMNMADAAKKGRMRGPSLPGESNPASKLIKEQVRQIRSLYVSGMSKHGLARAFGIHRKTVKQIVERKIWKEVAQ